MSEPQSLASLPWMLSLLVALISGAVGVLTSGVVAAAYASWYHVTTREGAASYLIVGIAVLGGIVFCIVGLIVARSFVPDTELGFAKAVAYSSGGTLAIGCLVAVVGYLFAEHPDAGSGSGQPLQNPLAQEEFEAQQKADEQAKFEAIPPDAPLREWLPYTAEWQSEERRSVAIGHMMNRASFASELGGLMLESDVRQAEAALSLTGQLPSPGSDILAAVAAAGRDIIGRIKRANATSAEQDPGYEAAADSAYRFSCWIAAVRALREKGRGDFIPELSEILELSRVRIDSEAMQQDVRRVASYYLKLWAGINPLPGDPPAR